MPTDTREPGPVVAVGAVVLRRDEVLLVRRAKAPGLGRWSIPGGAVRWGERLADAVVREVHEETGVSVKPLETLTVVELLDDGEGAGLQHHFLVVDYLCAYLAGEPRAASDAAEAVWVPREALSGYDLVGRTLEIVLEAFRTRGAGGGQ
jgi:8-oxo-dGTP diphosphatase